MVDILFMVDIVVGFRTSFINKKTGDEIWEPKKIAKNYICGTRFWLDLLSSIPLDLMASGSDSSAFLSVFGMLKLVRITRIGRII